MKAYLYAFAGLLLFVALAISGAALQAPVEARPIAAAPDVGVAAVDAIAAASTSAVPHPILSDVQVRRAIAYCTDKDALVAAAYPALSAAERQALIVDTFVLTTSWAYTAPATTYAYSPSTGQGLLDAAGWTVPVGGGYRTKDGMELVLTVTATDSAMRVAFLTVFEEQMATCGIRVIRNHVAASWLYGETTGLQVRDYEVSEFAWVTGDDPGGLELYSCDRIPAPENNWSLEHQNYMGWCNPIASGALITATNTALTQNERKAAYAVVINALAEDVPTLPLFVREGATPESAVWEHIDLNLEVYTTVTPAPHPALGDVRVRQAIAYCTDKDALVAAAYPALSLAERQALIIDTFVLTTSWAYTAPATTYPFSPTLGQGLLDAAGWTLPAGADYRVNDDKELVLTLKATDTAMRVAFLTVFEAQMHACGIRVIRTHTTPQWLYGPTTGLQVRDFEVSEYAWMTSDEEPYGRELYACDRIPAPENGWSTGYQNYMGWCNQIASDAAITATNTTLTRDERKAAYAVLINALAEDVPTLPLFVRDGATPELAYWEHIDFNLGTVMQSVDADPGVETVLTTMDYSGNVGKVAIPAGAVTETVSLAFTPLVGAANPPDNQGVALAFRLTASIGGVPQDGYPFAEPITLTVTYRDNDLVDVFDTGSLILYYWDGSSWQDAAMTCAPEDRYSDLNVAAKTLTVRLCHLTEFGLMGTRNNRVYLPLALR